MKRHSEPRGEVEWPLELEGRFASFEEWVEFCGQHPYISDRRYLEWVVQEVRTRGFYCPWHDRDVGPEEIRFGEPNYREGLVGKGLNSRLRAVVLEMERAGAGRSRLETRVYAPEAVTPFALQLRGRYPLFVGSEYSADEEQCKRLFPIRCESLMALSFPESTFDIVVVNDVFEHVPDVDRCLEEIGRVTRPGGTLISTFPFNIGALESIVKARLNPDGGIEYLAEPEYHGNPVDPKGSLVFEIPGWNILERAKAAGWDEARIVYTTSARHGIVGGDFSGIFVLVASR